MVYETKCSPIKNQHKNKLSVVEMMLLFGCIVNQNEIILKMLILNKVLGISPVVENMFETRLKRFEH